MLPDTLTRQVGKCHVGAKKFIDAFGENDHPWDRWSPPVFDDEDFLDLPAQAGREAAEVRAGNRLQTAGSPHCGQFGGRMDRAGRWQAIPSRSAVQLLPRPTSHGYLDDLIADGSAARHPIYLQLDIFDPHQPFSIPAGFEEREKELRSVMTVPDSYEEAQKRDWQRAQTSRRSSIFIAATGASTMKRS